MGWLTVQTAFWMQGSWHFLASWLKDRCRRRRRRSPQVMFVSAPGWVPGVGASFLAPSFAPRVESCLSRDLGREGQGFGSSGTVFSLRPCVLSATALAVRERRKAFRRTETRKRKNHQVSAISRSLYWSGEVLSTGTLPVGDNFELYYEEHGNPDGIPAVFLHGGPGAGCSRKMAQLFNPNRYRIILFDQRGCGKSKRKDSSSAEEQIEDNTTWHHVSDLEALREHLKIERWVVTGGSWGTCLALAYASKFKDRVLAMALRAAAWMQTSFFL